MEEINQVIGSPFASLILRTESSEDEWVKSESAHSDVTSFRANSRHSPSARLYATALKAVTISKVTHVLSLSNRVDQVT